MHANEARGAPPRIIVPTNELNLSRQFWMFVIHGIVQKEICRHLHKGKFHAATLVLIIRFFAEYDESPIMQVEEHLLHESV